MSAVSIPQRDLRRLMQSPHRIPAFHGRGSRDRVTLAVGDDFGPQIGTAIGSLARQRLIRMDDVSCALLEAHGINPAVTAALRNEIHVFSVRIGLTAVCEVEEALHVRTGDSGAWWYPGSSRIIGLPPVPDTLIGELEGAPLTKLLSHPALDALPLTIGSLGVARDTHVFVKGATWLSEELERYSRPLAERGEPASATAG